jgi:hypothetical protein
LSTVAFHAGHRELQRVPGELQSADEILTMLI